MALEVQAVLEDQVDLLEDQAALVVQVGQEVQVVAVLVDLGAITPVPVDQEALQPVNQTVELLQQSSLLLLTPFSTCHQDLSTMIPDHVGLQA